MKNKFNFVKKYKKSFITGGLVLVAILYFVLVGGENSTEAYTVKQANVEQSVMLSGKITTSDNADLGFASSGRVSRISVKNNQSVSQGQVLAQLEIGELLADLKIKELNSKTSNVDLENAKAELERITRREDTKVQNAYRTLLTEDLELVPDSSLYEVEPPLISGAYSGTEGQYKIRILRENSSSSNTRLLTFDLERTDRFINKEGSTPLGTKGLYISFPHDELDAYDDTTWYLDIPNKSSSSYLTNSSAYNEAKNNRDLEIKNAEFEYEKLLTEDDGGSSVAQAEIQKINAEIRKNTIYAPFKGKVTNIEKEVGENASTGERVITILGEEKLEVVLQVSELDVSKLSPGLPIEITIDAIPGEIFIGTVKTVNSRETEIEGVPVYEAFVELTSDDRIKTGMSASGTVVLAKKDNVLVVPLYLIKKESEKNFVKVMQEDGKSEEREITIGLQGTDSMVEVTSGLNGGEKILPLDIK